MVYPQRLKTQHCGHLESISIGPTSRFSGGRHKWLIGPLTAFGGPADHWRWAITMTDSELKLMRFEFYAWAASRAAMAGSSKAKTSVFRKALVDINIVDRVEMCSVSNVVDYDNWHFGLIYDVLQLLNKHNERISYGIAAKAVNVFMKGYWYLNCKSQIPSVRYGHPAIDSILLSAIDDRYETEFSKKYKWQKLDSDNYRKLIDLIRAIHKDMAIWKIEIIWKYAQQVDSAEAATND